MWPSVVVAAVCGALAGFVAAMLVRDRSQHRVLYAILFLATFAGLNTVGQRVVTPHLRAFDARRSADSVLSGNRLLAALVQRHPELRQSFVDMVEDLARRGATTKEAHSEGVAWGQAKVSEFLPRYLPVASDAALVHFSEANVAALDSLASRRSLGCVDWLNGRSDTSTGDPNFLPPEVIERFSDTLAEVIESSPAPSPSRVEPAVAEIDMQRVAATVAIKHGSDALGRIANLSSADLTEEQKIQVCEAVATLYRELLRFPDPRRSALLRYLYSQDSGPGSDAS